MDGAQMLTMCGHPPQTASSGSCCVNWDSTAGLSQLLSYLRSITAAEDTMLLTLLRWTVTGSATGPGGLEAERCQGQGLDWEVQTRWRNNHKGNSHHLRQERLALLVPLQPHSNRQGTIGVLISSFYR